MSKSALHKFKKNDYSYDDEEFVENKTKINKRKQKRFERAIKTKDLTMLIDNDFVDDWD